MRSPITRTGQHTEIRVCEKVEILARAILQRPLRECALTRN
jgi:hypothetical protein